ncbi:hypothetical protein ACSQ67_024021 [Phaseolus vulgaris]
MEARCGDLRPPKHKDKDFNSRVCTEFGESVRENVFEQKRGSSASGEADDGDGFRDLVYDCATEKMCSMIGISDMLLCQYKGSMVLDARDPQGTRFYHLEKHLKENWFSSLLSVLRQFARLKRDKQAISVGYPNVGKSSLCKSSGKLLKICEPKEEESEEPNVNGVDIDDAVDCNEASAAIKAIA